MTWSTEAYLAKATVMWSKATGQSRDSIDFYLYLTFVLEHVIRGALVSRNPALNAGRDDESLLYAAGGDARSPKTIELSRALAFIRRLIPEVSEAEIKAVTVLVDFRNTELHDDSTQFDEAVLRQAVPEVQVFVTRLLEFAGVEYATVLGKEDAARFEAVREARTKGRERRVRSVIETAKDRFFTLPKEEQERLREENAPKFLSAVMRGGRHILAYRCPACSGSGQLTGQPYGTSAPMLVEGDLEVESRVIPDGFECKICGLQLRGFDEIIAAPSLPHEFTSRNSIDVVEHFGIDPMEYIDESEVARRFYDEGGGFQDE